MSQSSRVDTPLPAKDSSRPGALKAARILSLMAAAAGMTAGITALADGKRTIHEFVTNTIGASSDSELVAGLIDQEINAAYSLLATKASVVLASAVLVALMALAAGRGKRVVRVLLTMFLVTHVLVSGLLGMETEVLPELSIIGAFLAVMLSLVTVPLLLTPAVRRFGSRDASGS